MSLNEYLRKSDISIRRTKLLYGLLELTVLRTAGLHSITYGL